MNGYVSGEKIMDALDLLDGDLVDEVAKLREREKRRPVLWRYGALAACLCVVMLGAVKLFPLLGAQVNEDGIAAPPEHTPENAPESAPEFSLDGTGGGDLGNDKYPEQESQSDEKVESAPDDEDSFDEGIGGLPGDEPLPALNLRIEGYDGDTVVCTVVGNEGCTFYPVGSVVVLRFDIWEGDPVTETTFTRGGVYSVLFNGGHDNSDENTLYAVIAYEVEE